MAMIRMPGSLIQRSNGTIWFRLHVPEKLRPWLGWELKRSLKTNDWTEAQRRYPAVAMWADTKLAAARAHLEATAPPPRAVDLEALEEAYEASLSPAWRAWDYALRHDGICLGPEPDERWKQPFSQTPLARLLGISRAIDVDQAVGEMATAGGSAGEGVQQVGPAVPLSAMFEAWAQERKPPDKTQAEWRRCVDRFQAFLGHDQAEKVTRKDVIRWKDALLANGKSAKTTTDLISTIRTLYNHAITNERLARQDNPAQGVRVVSRPDPGAGRRGFTEPEARRVLEAAREARPELRWLVWLLAATGARIGEIAQLAVQDIRCDQDGGGWFVAIEPGNGKRIKTVGSARSAPLTKELLEEGLLEYLETLPQDGRLFPGISPDTFGSYGGTATKKVGRFVRSLGLTDPRVAPAHSFRHLMATRLRAAGVSREIAEALLGHTRGAVHDRYGETWPLGVLRREGIDKLPRLFPGVPREGSK